MKKYEITKDAHQQYPWLHHICAVASFGDVSVGQVGGCIESEENLSQTGNCWLDYDAIAIEAAHVSGDARLGGHALARGQCLISGTAWVNNHAVIEDSAIVIAGAVFGKSHISGDAVVRANAVTKLTPLIYDDAAVYGTVSGNVAVCGDTVVLPGTKMENPTMDKIVLQGKEVSIERDYNREITSAASEMQPPKKHIKQGECL